jgi:hypothetical protein
MGHRGIPPGTKYICTNAIGAMTTRLGRDVHLERMPVTDCICATRRGAGMMASRPRLTRLRTCFKNPDFHGQWAGISPSDTERTRAFSAKRCLPERLFSRAARRGLFRPAPCDSLRGGLLKHTLIARSFGFDTPCQRFPAATECRIGPRSRLETAPSGTGLLALPMYRTQLEAALSI